MLLLRLYFCDSISDCLFWDIVILSLKTMILAFILVIQDDTFLNIPLKHDLPVLYEEDGKEVLRFSELFGQHELPWGYKKDKKYHKRLVFRGELKKTA